QRPEFTGPKTTDPGKNGFPGRLPPVDVGSSETCRFCNKSLNDGTYDWVVESVQRHSSFEKFETGAQPDVETMADEATRFRSLQPTELLTVVAGVLMADGQLTESEKKFLSQLAGHQKVSATQLQECLSAATSVDGNITLPDDQGQLKLFLNALLRAALADGNVCRSERDMLLRITQPIGWSVIDLKQHIGRIRRDMYHEAKRSLKQSKKTKSRSSGIAT
ncbi:MAG: hypothetical protein O2856_15645, partial [Planctomycetota bacterium]|nr:hypothetical protein [Planctomycetota bacterium]